MIRKVLDLRPWVAAGVIDGRDGGPGDWARGAVCAQTDPDAFYPEAEAGGRCESAKSICARCEVRVECLTYALVTRERFGVWGGTSAHEREKMPLPAPPDTSGRILRRAPAPAGSVYHVQQRREAEVVRMMAAGISTEVVAEAVELVPDTVRRLWREHQRSQDVTEQIRCGDKPLAA